MKEADDCGYIESHAITNEVFVYEICSNESNE